ncbi:MAG: hypothetical protein HY252_10830 [Sphingobacteriales bacterium]|nr:hypothetical protein [Sphingobacteriales bacterium]
MKKKFILVILLWTLGFTIVSGQTYTMKMQISESEKSALLKLEKELFPISPSISYKISSYDPLKSFLEIKDQEPLDENYLQKRKTSLQTDSLNPILINDIGNYYNFHERTDSALYFFKKSFENLNIKYFENDSAEYLSFRGVLKLNLGVENAVEDIENALKINPNDSMAKAFYPIFLINKGEFKRASDISIRMLDTDTTDVVVWFVVLATSEIFDGIYEKTAEVVSNEKLKSQYSRTDYTKLISFRLIDKYADKYKTNTAVRNARYMADIFALLLKVSLFNEMTENKIFYTAYEKQKLISLEKFFISTKLNSELNAYAINKNLGFIYFLLQKNDKALLYFDQAIKVFPDSKKQMSFNPSEIYDAMLGIYFINKADSSVRQTLLLKIKAEPEGNKNAEDYLILAKSYYLSDDMKEAEDWANKAYAINSKDFEVLRLLSHLNMLNGNNAVAQSYTTEALKNIQSNKEQSEIALQYAIYYLINGDAATAYNNIEIARKSLTDDPCTLCDKLIEKYIIINPK